MTALNVDIALASAADLEAIECCARDAYSRYIARMGKTPAPMLADFASQIAHGWVHVARADQQVLGYVVFYPTEDTLHLESVAVAPAYAGQAIGRRLIEFAEQSALKAQLSCVTLYTNSAMTENLSLYPRLGYVETHRAMQHGFHRVFFQKLL